MSVPCLALSATVNMKVLADIKDVLKLHDDELNVIALLPDRPDIFLEVVHQKSYDIERD